MTYFSRTYRVPEACQIGNNYALTAPAYVTTYVLLVDYGLYTVYARRVCTVEPGRRKPETVTGHVAIKNFEPNAEMTPRSVVAPGWPRCCWPSPHSACCIHMHARRRG